MGRIRILHVENHAGVAHELAVAQRRAGHEATVLETWWNPTDQPHDVDLYYGRDGALSDLGKIRKVMRFCKGYDIVHVHGGLNWKRFDIVGMKLLYRKPIVVHYHGSETREGFGMSYGWLPDRRIVSRPDLLKWHPDATFIPNPVPEYPYSFDPATKPRVIHLTNNRSTKGTDLIIETMDELKRSVDFDFKLIEKRPHEEAIREIARSHILIDQVIDHSKIGVPSVIGVASLEAMSMGLAVISTFDDEYRNYYPGCPVSVILPSKEDLRSRVKSFLEDIEGARKLGLEGREHVLRSHSPDVLAGRTLDIYRSVLEDRK